MNSTSTIPPSLFSQQRYSAALRLWHWASFIVMSASLITVLLASTVFKTKPNVPVVVEQVQSKGGQVTNEQAWAVAHEFNDKFWELHKWLGVGLCVLLLVRLILVFTQPGEENLMGKLKMAKLLPAAGGEAAADRLHFIRVKQSYLAFYVLLGIMGLTGLVLAFEDVEMLKPIHQASKQIHSFSQYLMYFFILIHLGGVIRADLGRNRGMVSSMINGGGANKE
jgi:Ni/Fe-hydrogenase 1 B-type cytochrome subunit